MGLGFWVLGSGVFRAAFCGLGGCWACGLGLAYAMGRRKHDLFLELFFFGPPSLGMYSLCNCIDPSPGALVHML